LYRTKFYREFSGLLPNADYKEFITFFYVTKQNIFQFLLYDAKNGSFPGTISLPRNEICKRFRSIIIFGFKGKVLVSCKINGDIKANIYEPEVSNEADGFQLILRNGTKVSLVVYRARIRMSGGVYHVGLQYGRLHVFAYRKENKYKYVKYLIRLMTTSRTYGFVFNPWYGLFFVFHFPGPEAIVMKEIYEPSAGLLKNGSGKTFREMTSSFYPRSNDHKSLHFMFNPLDGTLLHLIRNLRKKIDVQFTRVDIYQLVI
jgi:hypothetical protein